MRQDTGRQPPNRCPARDAVKISGYAKSIATFLIAYFFFS